MRKSCPVCKGPFDAPPTGALTCSIECRKKWMSISRVGVTRKWSKSSREQLSQLGQTDNLKLGTDAALKSPIAGPFETNREAKIWHLQNLTTGERYKVRNLRKFCRDNPKLFAPTPWETASRGIMAVQASIAGSRLRGSVPKYKNWTLVKPAEQPSASPRESPRDRPK